MIRIAESDGWILVGHQSHAQLAGEFARAWGNDDFATPEPKTDIYEAVSRHDDAWAERDALPFLTREGRPGAFSRELVGSYSAFEEIDLADYLAVRGRATEAVATDNPYAAILISMHTVNLLTEQADLSSLTAEQLALHTKFIEGQRQRQRALAAKVTAAGRAKDVQPAALDRAFKFLQICDNLSLITCVRFSKSRELRHAHPRRDGLLVTLECTPLSATYYQISPYPFSNDEMSFTVPARRVSGVTFASQDAFRDAYDAAPVFLLPITVVR